MNLTGTSNGTATTDMMGNYGFAGLSNGGYTVTPSRTGYAFTPANQPVTVSGANVPGQNFTSAAVPTYSISGTVSGAVVSGVTISLTGASPGTTTTDGQGNYSFVGLSNGSYTATPSKTGYTFTPSSQGVTIIGANAPAVNFTDAIAPTWSISGTISPVSLVNGATVALSGAATGSTSVDASSGNYTFTNLLAGTYTVTPSNPGVSFTPASQNVSLTVGNAAGVNFIAKTAVGVATVAIDANVSTDGAKATTVSSPVFSTASSNELLLAFIATDYLGGVNTIVTGVTGGGLTWTLVVRSNAQDGSSEVWRAFSNVPLSNVTVAATLSQSVISSLTVMSFSGVDATGTNGSGAIGAFKSAGAATGAPSATLTTMRNGSWTFGVGNDFDNAIARIPGANQVLVHQALTSTGDTYWVQMQNSPTPVSGTSVTINDTAPTADRYNLAIIEVLPGIVTNGTPPSVAVTSPAPSGTVTTLATVSANATDSNYAITGVQFLLDGGNLASQVTSAPYSITWDSSAVTAGTHTLSAIAYNSAGMNATASPVTVTVDHSGNAAVVGSWSSVLNLPTVAMNVILLKNNKLMFYEDGGSVTIWDYLNNIFASAPISVNLFCSGFASLADGRILVVGGYGGSSNTIGITNAEIFDPSNNSWTTAPNMSYRRWYPTATTLSDGRILVTAGWQTTGHTNAGVPEVYDPSTNQWTKLTNANNPFETYPFMFVLQDGRIIHVGGTEYATNTDILNVSTQSWSVVDSRIIDGGAASMYLPGKMMKAGSATDSQGTGPSSNTTFVLDTTQPTPAWQQTPSMAYPRSFLNLTELRDGSVLATGGETDKNGGTIANAVYAAELWSPQTQTWTTMSSMKTPREYHSTALLLPDARVLVSGMGNDFGQVPDETNAEIFSPPYLFKGARPTISSTPAQIQYGTNFSVTTPDYASISKVLLIRTGATTHFFDQNTRYVPLAFQQTTGGLTVTGPVDGNLAPPGYYMLFLVNGSGVPSIASIVQVP
jgi:N-acetylneuraminic acid mutarotase